MSYQQPRSSTWPVRRIILVPETLGNNESFNESLSVIHCHLNNYTTPIFEKSIAFLKSRFAWNYFWRNKMTCWILWWQRFCYLWFHSGGSWQECDFDWRNSLSSSVAEVNHWLPIENWWEKLLLSSWVSFLSWGSAPSPSWFWGMVLLNFWEERRLTGQWIRWMTHGIWKVACSHL